MQPPVGIKPLRELLFDFVLVDDHRFPIHSNLHCLPEPFVARIDEITVSYENRNVTVEIAATMVDGKKIRL